MIAISADFDPVHKGHEELIKKAREIADEKGIEVVIYMNKGYSANHAPFFTPFEARKEMALALGADKVIGIEGLHHRLILSYSVPIRLAKMQEDGVTDYITAADISLEEVKNYAQRFINEGSFLGMPQDFPNRNVIRWYAINEFLSKKFNRKIDPEKWPCNKRGHKKIASQNNNRNIGEGNRKWNNSWKKEYESSET